MGNIDNIKSVFYGMGYAFFLMIVFIPAILLGILFAFDNEPDPLEDMFVHRRDWNA